MEPLWNFTIIKMFSELAQIDCMEVNEENEEVWILGLKFLFLLVGSLVSLPAELSEENLSKQSSVYSVGNKLSQKFIPLIVEEKVPNSSSFLDRKSVV